MNGILYLCATPIGNLEDITFRALNLLKNVNLIAAEDTRHTKKLLNHYDIKTPMTSYYEHNKITKGPQLIKKLLNGTNIALVTDAGTPGISDPGEDLVRLCYKNNITVTSLPGASAVITALILSGLPTRRFIFEGFLPRDKKELKSVIESFKNETRTIVIYEAPHRLKETLNKLYNVIGDRDIALVKELTKKHETIDQLTISDAIQKFMIEPPRGEYVVVIKGRDIQEIKDEQMMKFNNISLKDHMSMYLSKGLSKKEAMKLVAKDRGVSKRDIYAEINIK